jgi:hypothetical protein
MAHGTEHHLEHAEHAAHGGHGGHGEHGGHAEHDPFNMRVAMTMAIVAAVLACVTMLSHRSHNDTLRLQNEANRIQTQANIDHTKASDQWSYFQAKKNRQYLNENDADMLTVNADSGEDKKPSSRAIELASDWRKKAKGYKKDSEKIEHEAEKLAHEAEELQHESTEKLEDSHKIHLKSNRFDLSELGVEMALVLCSIAVLTKLRMFWYSGIGFGLVGLAVALTALFGLWLH